MKFNKYKIVSNDNILKKMIKNNRFLYLSLLKTRAFLNQKRLGKIRKDNVLMLHNGRVGSTVLADLISRHSKVQWDGELFVKRGLYYRYFKNHPLDFLKLRSKQTLTPYYGFEIKAMPRQHLKPEILDSDLKSFINYLKQHGFNRFISLKRKNYLRQYISLLRAREMNIKHTNKKITAKKIYIDINNAYIVKSKPDTLLNIFADLDRFYIGKQEVLENEKTLFLTYEKDILSNPKTAYKKVCDFLNIEDENPEVSLKRTNPFSVKDIIENYTEVEQHLQNTRYEWMLYD